MPLASSHAKGAVKGSSDKPSRQSDCNQLLAHSVNMRNFTLMYITSPNLSKRRSSSSEESVANSSPPLPPQNTEDHPQRSLSRPLQPGPPSRELFVLRLTNHVGVSADYIGVPYFVGNSHVAESAETSSNTEPSSFLQISPQKILTIFSFNSKTDPYSDLERNPHNIVTFMVALVVTRSILKPMAGQPPPRAPSLPLCNIEPRCRRCSCAGAYGWACWRGKCRGLTDYQ